jgi:hypothetical protein
VNVKNKKKKKHASGIRTASHSDNVTPPVRSLKKRKGRKPQKRGIRRGGRS